MKRILLAFCLLLSCRKPIVLSIADTELRFVPKTSFAISSTEVTYALWYRVHQWAEPRYQFSSLGAEGSQGRPGAAPQDQQPVTQVSWGDALIWCNALSEYYHAQEEQTFLLEPVYRGPDGKVLRSAEQANAGNFQRLETVLGFRLPTEREWLVASQAHKAVANPRTVAWYAENSAAQTWPVASKRPSKGGLYDMRGNVAEWVEDPYQNLPFRTLKGGAFFSPANELQLEKSLPAMPQQSHIGIGFRLAFSLEE